MLKALSLGKGFVHLYTGEGKGKTTAALGLCMRAAGQGLRCRVIQFIKGNPDSGELKSARKLAPELEIVQYGLQEWFDYQNPSAQHRKLVLAGFEDAKQSIASGVYQVVVLDEICIAVSTGIIPVEELLEMIRTKPDGIELILTGRDAPSELARVADLVTEMLQIQHYYAQGVSPRRGIEV